MGFPGFVWKQIANLHARDHIQDYPQDQFGGDFDRKFLRNHFYLTLLEIHEFPMEKQKEFLGKKLNDWMKDKIQTDDITVMGIRL